MSGENGQLLIDTINSINQNLLHINAGTTNDRDSLGGTGGTIDYVGEQILALNRGSKQATKKDYGDIAGQYINGYNNVTRSVAHNLYGSQSQRVKDKIDETISRASIPPFGPNGDPCNFGKDEQRALATLNSINQRIFNFILNIQPLFNYGYPMATPDTLNMLVAYLQHKIISDYDTNGNLGIIVEGVEFVARTCSTEEPPDGEVEFNPALIQDPMDRLKYIIKQMLSQVLYNIGMDGKDYNTSDNFRGWGIIKENMFESLNNGTGRSDDGLFKLNDSQRYRMLTSYFHNGENLGTIGQATYNLPQYLRYVRGLNDLPRIESDRRDFAKEQFLGLVPVPLLTGIQYLYYDKVVAVTDKYPTMAYYARKRLEEADNALRSLIQEEATPLSQIPQAEIVAPPTVDDLINIDKQKKAERLAAKKALLEANQRDPDGIGGRAQEQQNVINRAGGNFEVVTPEEREEANRRAQQEGGQEQAQEQERLEEQQRQYPRQFGGRTYNNQNELVRDKRKYEDLLERANAIRSHKTALETRLRLFGNEVARSEAEYKATDHWGTEYARYDAFLQDPAGGPSQAYRGAIHSFVLNINHGSSLGITQYGTNQQDGGNSQQQRAFNNSTDLKISNKDSITAADFATSRTFHPTNPPVRSEALSNAGLKPLYMLLFNAMKSDTAGLSDRSETSKFYGHIVDAATQAFGFSRTPAKRYEGYDINPPMAMGSTWARNNTVVGILCLISYTVAQLDESALFRDLGISSWNPEERTRVTGIIEEMTNFINQT